MNDIEAAVFKSVYGSREQRQLRLLAMGLLVLKHGLRGFLFSWPLYFIALVPFLVPAETGWWVVLFIFPAVLVSGHILLMGLRDDYSEYITNKLLSSEKLTQILWGTINHQTH